MVSTKLPRSEMSRGGVHSIRHSLGTGYLYIFLLLRRSHQALIGPTTPEGKGEGVLVTIDRVIE